MSEVWVCFPTANPAQCFETFSRWKRMGYMTAALTDGPMLWPINNCDLRIHVADYQGYAVSVNGLLKTVFSETDANFCIAAGDDIEPDPTKTAGDVEKIALSIFPDTYGVVQFTGDDGGQWMPKTSERNAVSPWIGRDFAKRAYGGNGPFWSGYHHYFADSELQRVAQRLGCFAQFPEITQYHAHWSREGRPEPTYLKDKLAGWDEAKMLFETRQMQNFPGHEPIE